MARFQTGILAIALTFASVSSRVPYDQTRYFNFGGGQVVSDDIIWKSDLRHNSLTVTSNTKTYRTRVGIFARKYARVYKDHRYIPRWAGNTLKIKIPVRPDVYDVTLMWAETVKKMRWHKRLFAVNVNGKKWRNRFGGIYLNVYAYAGGLNRPYAYTFRRVPALDGYITITLTRACRRARYGKCICIKACRGCRGPQFRASVKPWCYYCPKTVICSQNPFISGAIVKTSA